MSVDGHDKFCGSFDKFSDCPKCYKLFLKAEQDYKNKPEPEITKWEIWAMENLWNKTADETKVHP